MGWIRLSSPKQGSEDVVHLLALDSETDNRPFFLSPNPTTASRIASRENDSRDSRAEVARVLEL